MDKVVISQLTPEHLRGKRVFLRIDVDAEPTPSGVSVALDKLQASLPTLKYLKSVGSRIVIGTHLGDPAGKIAEFIDIDGLEVILLHVRHPGGFLGTDIWSDPQTKRQREIERHYQVERIFMAANAALARRGLVSHRQISVEGDLADEILRCAEDIRADLIVMGLRGQSGLRKFVMGSVSRKVTNHSRCPVLIVRAPPEEISRAG